MDAGTGLRKATYLIRGQAISLVFVPCLADAHPAADEKEVHTMDTPGGPLTDRPPSWTSRRIRRALGRDPAYSEKLRDRIGYAATMHRIDSGGV